MSELKATHKLWCHHCSDSGFIIARHRKNEGMFSFRCMNCETSKRWSQLIPEWNLGRESVYILADDYVPKPIEKVEEEEIPF